MVALLGLIIRVFLYVIFLNDDGFAYQRSPEGVVVYVQVRSHTFLPQYQCELWYGRCNATSSCVDLFQFCETVLVVVVIEMWQAAHLNITN